MNWDENALARACADTLPSDDHQALIRSISQLFPEKSVTLAHTKPEWYRLGGLVDDEGNKVTDHLREWVESHDADDVLGLYEAEGEEILYVTRIVGKTMYLVVPTGNEPLNYIQVEVDVIQEVVDRLLFDEENLADDFEDLIDPMDYEKAEPKQISLPRYELRKARNMSEVHAMIQPDSTFKRFYDEWQASSAKDKGHFSDHWVLSFMKYHGAFDEITTEIIPLARQKEQVPSVDADKLGQGEELAKFIHKFDRSVGYPMAWYFSMLTTEKNLHKVAEHIFEDLEGEYAYLPNKDLQILKNWVEDPYCF